jgi:hypothetical protein
LLQGGSSLLARWRPVLSRCAAAPLRRSSYSLYRSNARRIRRTHCLGRSLRSHSRRRTTRNPDDLSVRLTRTSRLRLRAIFAFQYARFVLGMRPHSGHPCQKQPSTKTARRLPLNSKSGFPGTFDDCRRHPLSPFSLSSAASRSSVVLLPDDRIARIFLLRLSAGLLKEGSPICGSHSR